MSTQFQSLESRTFLSASPISKAQLVADQAIVVAQLNAASATFKSLVVQLKADNKAIASDLKSLPKTNAPLARALAVDVAKSQARVTTDLAILKKTVVPLVNKSTATGSRLIGKATQKDVTAAAAELTALNTLPAPSISLVQTSLDVAAFTADYNALVAANPNAGQLATDVSVATGQISAKLSSTSSSITDFGTAVTNFTNDLSAIVTAVGTYPNLVGTFNGTATVGTGAHKGQVAAFSFVFTNQTSTGALTGTITDLDTGATDPVTGGVSLNGTVALKATTAAGTKVTILGNAASSAISGIYKTGKNRGTFSVIELLI